MPSSLNPKTTRLIRGGESGSRVVHHKATTPEAVDAAGRPDLNNGRAGQSSEKWRFSGMLAAVLGHCFDYCDQARLLLVHFLSSPVAARPYYAAAQHFHEALEIFPFPSTAALDRKDDRLRSRADRVAAADWAAFAVGARAAPVGETADSVRDLVDLALIERVEFLRHPLDRIEPLAGGAKSRSCRLIGAHQYAVVLAAEEAGEGAHSGGPRRPRPPLTVQLVGSSAQRQGPLRFADDARRAADASDLHRT
jgi:hypothetical protein